LLFCLQISGQTSINAAIAEELSIRRQGPRIIFLFNKIRRPLGKKPGRGRASRCSVSAVDRAALAMETRPGQKNVKNVCAYELFGRGFRLYDQKNQRE
jgi:hypothetical protein